MTGYIERERYLRQLISKKDSGEVKIITGLRRCGKSWLLGKLYHDWLVGQGVPEDHIVSISPDELNLQPGADLNEPLQLIHCLRERIRDDGRYCVFLDGLQKVPGFERIVNGLNARDNTDVYITGSDSRFLSGGMSTLLRGRCDEVRVFPLSFSEFCAVRHEPPDVLWKEYCTFGGMPGAVGLRTPLEKRDCLTRLWDTICLDIAQRSHIRKRQALEGAAELLCYSVGSPVNPSRISASLRSTFGIIVSDDTVRSYLDALEKALLFSGVRRFSIRERRYSRNIRKYCISDPGLISAVTGFRQQDFPHLMENIVFNELLARGWRADAGIIESRESRDGRQSFCQREVGFIAEKGADRVYIQLSSSVPSGADLEQVTRPLRMIRDSFRKIVIVGSGIAPYTDDCGISFMGLFDFLLDEKAL